MGVCLAGCCQAKNATIKRNGVSPDMLVYGRVLRWMSSTLNEDDGDSRLAALNPEGAAWKTLQLWTVAIKALHGLVLRSAIAGHFFELQQIQRIRYACQGPGSTSGCRV